MLGGKNREQDVGDVVEEGVNISYTVMTRKLTEKGACEQNSKEIRDN